MSSPKNKRLYDNIVQEAKNKFNVWPSAYASGWVVKEYKRRGGVYTGNKKNTSLRRWYDEQWIDACVWPKRQTCGRTSNDRNYPYCRPSKRINSKTPVTIQELSTADRKKLCSIKRQYPLKRMKSIKRHGRKSSTPSRRRRKSSTPSRRRRKSPTPSRRRRKSPTPSRRRRKLN